MTDEMKFADQLPFGFDIGENSEDFSLALNCARDNLAVEPGLPLLLCEGVRHHRKLAPALPVESCVNNYYCPFDQRASHWRVFGAVDTDRGFWRCRAGRNVHGH